jgi:multimeric flavodoxin WrbA
LKILALVGSYRKRGNTARIVNLIAEEMLGKAARQNQTVELETVYLAHQELGFCRGCRVCFDQGEERCPLRDDLLAIRARMQEADGLIVAAPVYVNDVNAAVKNWIDRLAFACHRPEFAGKSAYLVATVADSPTGHALKTVQVALQTWGYHIAGKAGFKMGALMDQDQMEARYRLRAERIAKDLLDSVATDRCRKPSFLSLMTFKIMQLARQRNRDGSIDDAYWKSRGWTDPGREFFIPHRAGQIKVALARLAGALLALFVI